MDELTKTILSIIAIPTAIFVSIQTYRNIRQNSTAGIKADLELLSMIEKDSEQYQTIKKRVDKKIQFTYSEKPKVFISIKGFIFGLLLIGIYLSPLATKTVVSLDNLEGFLWVMCCVVGYTLVGESINWNAVKQIVRKDIGSQGQDKRK